MKKHVMAWVVGLSFIAAGFSLAGCEPMDDPKITKTICKQEDGGLSEC